jgi:hypothetical protein
VIHYLFDTVVEGGNVSAQYFVDATIFFVLYFQDSTDTGVGFLVYLNNLDAFDHSRTQNPVDCKTVCLALAWANESLAHHSIACFAELSVHDPILKLVAESRVGTGPLTGFSLSLALPVNVHGVLIGG